MSGTFPTRTGYKIVSYDMLSAYTHSQVCYELGRWVLPPPGHGALAVFETLDDALAMLVGTTTFLPLLVYECEYRPARWSLFLNGSGVWFPYQGLARGFAFLRGHRVKACEGILPRGTVFADAVRLVELVYVYDGEDDEEVVHAYEGEDEDDEADEEVDG
ncbi:MAG: hypothetical protein Q6370_004065 [Candidatus Sigynarchaeota archaeon]